MKRNLFPLHMTPFEAYMLADDSPTHPMTFVLVCELAGKIDRGAFQSAINEGLTRHPMLRSIVQPAKGGHDCWVPPENPDTSVRWVSCDAKSAGEPIYAEGSGVYIDIRRCIGFRCWCQSSAESAKLTCVFHHSACDGIGAIQFLGDVFWYYAKSKGSNLGPLPELPPSGLRARLRDSLGDEILSKVRESENPPPGPSQPVACTATAKPQSKYVFPDILTYTIDKDEHRSIRLAAQAAGNTVNDLLLESLFVALRWWNRTAEETRNEDAPRQSTLANELPLCINVPLDLRQVNHTLKSACNMVSCWFLRRSPKLIKDRTELGESLRTELLRVKAERFESPLMRYLVSQPLHDRDDQAVLSQDCKATVVFSNPGDPTKRFLAPLPTRRGRIEIGNLTLEALYGSAPLRPLTRIAVSVSTYRRELRVSLRYDPQELDRDVGNAILNKLIEEIRSSATVGSTSDG